MDKKKVVSILVILTVTATLAFSAMRFFLESNRVYRELHESRVYEAYLDANDITRKLMGFVYDFYDNIYKINRVLGPESVHSNDTKLQILYWKCELLETSARIGWLDISRDLNDLERLAHLDKEISFFNTSAFETIYNVIREALGQVEWARPLGVPRTTEEELDEAPAFLWELYYVLGVDEVEQYNPKSGLLALSMCFSELDSYWYLESKYGKENISTDWTAPQIALEWALGNATALHQELFQWDKHQRSRLYPD